MPTFGDLASELSGRLPGLSPFLAETFITRAWSKVRDERRWAWLVYDGSVNCPALVSTGAAAITQFSPTVTMSVAATTALNAIAAPALTALQIRFMGTGQTSQIYNITAGSGSPLTLTLDRVVQEPTNAASQYMVYRVYIVPPIADFLQWESLDDMVNGIRIVKGQLSLSSTYFDIRDPQRQALGLSYYCGYYRAAASSNGTSETDSAPIYELWPGSTQGQNFYVRFRRRGVDPAMSDSLPTQIPDEMVIAEALASHGYPHAKANSGFFPSFRGVGFTDLILAARQEYKTRLTLAKKQDDEQANSSVLNRGHGLRRSIGSMGFPYPIDSNFFQSHPVFW